MKGTIRFCTAALAALFFGLTATAEKTTTWKGGSGKFTDDNWDNGTPATGDIVILQASADGTVVENDIEGLSLASLQTKMGCPRIRVTGHDLTLTATLALKMWDGNGKIGTPVTFDIALTVERSGGTTMNLKDVIFNKPVTVAYQGKPQKVTMSESNGSAEFHGEFTAGNVNCWNNFTVKCYAPVHVGEVNSGSGSSYAYQLYDGAQGSTFASYTVNYYGGLWCAAEDVMPHDLVMNFGLGSVGDGEGDVNKSRYVINFDQTGDRIVGEAPIKTGETALRNQHHINTEGSYRATLTLRGTDDASCFAQTTGNLSLVWDPTNDFTQVFNDREQLMTGSITVKGGTVKSAGVNRFTSVPRLDLLGGTFEVDSSTYACFPALTVLNVYDGGVFRVTEKADVSPLTAGTATVTLKNGGKFRLDEGMSVSVAVLSCDGYYPAAGTYTGRGFGTDGVTEVDWIEGAGRVTVANTGYVSWKADAGGFFDEAANWSTGTVPGPDDVACLTTAGNGYTVTLRDTRTLPRQIRVGNVSGTTKLVVDADETVRTADLSVNEGGEVEIADGRTVSWQGTILVGEDIDCGRKAVFRVSGGAFTHLPQTSGVGFRMKRDARLVMTAGSFVSDYAQAQTASSFANEGGEICVTGGEFGPAAKGETHDAAMTYTLSGRDDFSGGTFRAVGTLRFDAADAADTTEIVFRDSAKWSAIKGIGLYVGGTAGTAKMDILTQVAGDQNTEMSHRNRIGYLGGTGHLTISNVSIYTAAESFHVGSMDKDKSDLGGRGYVEIQKGGYLRINGEGSRSTDWTSAFLQGLELGYGGSVKNLTSGHPYYGEMNVRAGGKLVNRYGDTVLGTAFGEGRLLVDGGIFNHCADNPASFACSNRFLSVGTAGGIGDFTVRNGGAVDVACHTFVAGPNKVRFVQQAGVSSALGTGASAGTFTVADATVSLRRDLTIGEDGAGTCEIVGSEGSFSVGELVLTNVAAVATSGATLKFTADADGVKPLMVTKAVTIRGNAKLVVDLSSYQGRKAKLKLLSCASHEGAFAETSVTWPADCSSGADVKWIGNDLYAVRDGYGLMLIIR